MTEPRAHPDLPAEQAYIDAAYDRLDEIREEAIARANERARQHETAFQLVYERDVAVRFALERARSLDVGDESLIFGRTDSEHDERYYIGRRAVFDEQRRPLVVDWRVPAAEPFYRATGRHPLGLAMRRHFLCEGRRLLSIEDERLSESGTELGLAGSGALLAAMERPRTRQMRDIVATVQAEQDMVIRDELSGVLAVQGGPGTGKTAVALHRAAYLLFTHRQKLARQGLLVVGPTRRFLRYIDQVLPALGEGGVLLATLGDLAPSARVERYEEPAVARIKGDVRMARVVARAVKLRQRPLGRALNVNFDDVKLTLHKKELDGLIAAARRNRRSHNARRWMLLSIMVDKLYARYVKQSKNLYGAVGRVRRKDARNELRAHPAVIGALNEMWPALTPQELVAQLLSSREQLAATAKGILRREEINRLLRTEGDAWTGSDVPLLDETQTRLGIVEPRRKVATLDDDDDPDELDTYGHIIVDEAQDLSPMALRMIARRSRTGSITLVGDVAQAISSTPLSSWDEILEQLPQRDGTRLRQLTVNYRTPGAIMDVATLVLTEAAPDLHPPRSAREGGEPITFEPGDPAATVARLAKEQRARDEGTLAVIAPHSMLGDMTVAADTNEEDEVVAVLSVEEAKGLEFDSVVVVEPAQLIEESLQGMRALYVAMTRATQRVTVAYDGRLPRVLQGV